MTIILDTQAQIGNLHRTIKVEKDVGWLQVAMNAVLTMEEGQALEDLTGYICNKRLAKGYSVDQISQCPTFA